MKLKAAWGLGAGLLLLFGGIAYAEGAYKTIEVFFERINVTVNGQKAELSKDSIFYNGSVYVPLRGLAEMLGAEVSWNDRTRSVNLDFLKDRRDDVYRASTQGLYQYIAIQQNQIVSDMIRYFQSDDMESMKEVVSRYDQLIGLAKDVQDETNAATMEKMKAAVELLRSGWENKSVDDYSLAWTIYYVNADNLNKSLKDILSGKTKLDFEVRQAQP